MKSGRAIPAGSETGVNIPFLGYHRSASEYYLIFLLIPQLCTAIPLSVPHSKVGETGDGRSGRHPFPRKAIYTVIRTLLTLCMEFSRING